MRTQLKDKSEILPTHPAYSEPSSVVNQAKEFIAAQFAEDAKGILNMDKVVERFFEATKLESPPLRLPLGHVGIKRIRDHMKLVAENIDSYESWSDGLDV